MTPSLRPDPCLPVCGGLACVGAGNTHRRIFSVVGRRQQAGCKVGEVLVLAAMSLICLRYAQ
jgi:hypothetical protein